MTTDRELLELAALAAGLQLTWGEKYRVGDTEVDCTDIPYALSNDREEAPCHWNPLTDDGDALRLAVKTGVMDGRGFSGQWIALYAVGKLPKDRYEAYRLCITRAAAEVGRRMKEQSDGN